MEPSTEPSDTTTTKAPPSEPSLQVPAEADRPARQDRAAKVEQMPSTSGRWAMVATLIGGDMIVNLCLLGLMKGGALWLVPVHGLGGLLLSAMLLGLPVSLGLAGFYRPRFVHPALEMKQLAVFVGAVGGTAVLTSLFLNADSNVVALIGFGAAAGTLLLPVGRVTTRVLAARCSWWGLPTVIITLDEAMDGVVDTLTRWPEIGLRPVAWLGERDLSTDTDLIRGGPNLAPYLARSADVPYAILSVPERGHPNCAKRMAHYGKFFDHLLTVQGGSGSVSWTTGPSGDGLCSYSVGNAASNATTQALKRTLDLFGAVFLLILFAPLFVTIAALICFDSEGPVFYRQERLGREGKTFTLLKFRSMYRDADQRLQKVLKADPQRRREYEKYHKLQNDPRVTDIGQILREYSLDELPQLLNVIKGDMSLIGPRAYLPAELPDMKGLEPAILQTPPGVTGLWQVSGRNQLEFKERVDLDVHYVQNWSIWLDLYLLVRTIPTVFTGEGAA